MLCRWANSIVAVGCFGINLLGWVVLQRGSDVWHPGAGVPFAFNDTLAKGTQVILARRFNEKNRPSPP